MQLKKYIKISPHALRAFTFYASCLVRQFPAAGKNTLGFRHMMRTLIDFSARVPAEELPC